MRISISILILFFLTGLSFGQGIRQIDIPVYPNNSGTSAADTSLWYKVYHELAKQINVENLEIQTDTFHFRFWTTYQAIDIFTKDHRTYFGYITNFARKYNDKLLKKNVYMIEKVLSKQIRLDTAMARTIYNQLLQLSILSIPSDDRIKGWSQGLDGEEFIIESSTKDRYAFKTYWTPRAQADSVSEAKQIQTFVKYLIDDVKINEYYNKLKLPPGNYLHNGIPGIQINMSPDYFIKQSILDWF